MAQRRRPSRRDYEEAAELRLALRRFLRRSEQVTRSHGLTPQRYQLLLLVKTLDGEATIGAVSRSLELGQSNATQLVQRAEGLGLVHRERSTRDARVRYVRLTPEGERRLSAAVAELGGDRAKLVASLKEIEQ